MFDKILLVAWGLFGFLYGISHVSNIQIVWMEPITGLSALVAGALTLLRAFR